MNARPTALLICVNHRFKTGEPSCAGRGSEGIADTIEKAVIERRIDITVERIICLGQCDKGPTLKLVPGGRFILGTSPEMIPEILNELEVVCGRRPEAEAGPPVHLLGS